MRTMLSKLTKSPQKIKQQKSEISDLNVSKTFIKFDPVLSQLSGTPLPNSCLQRGSFQDFHWPSKHQGSEKRSLGLWS